MTSTPATRRTPASHHPGRRTGRRRCRRRAGPNHEKDQHRDHVQRLRPDLHVLSLTYGQPGFQGHSSPQGVRRPSAESRPAPRSLSLPCASGPRPTGAGAHRWSTEVHMGAVVAASARRSLSSDVSFGGWAPGVSSRSFAGCPMDAATAIWSRHWSTSQARSSRSRRRWCPGEESVDVGGNQFEAVPRRRQVSQGKWDDLNEIIGGLERI